MHRLSVTVKVTQSCLTLHDPMEHLQARILEWAAIPLSRRSSRPRDRTWVSALQADFLLLERPGKSQKHQNQPAKDQTSKRCDGISYSALRSSHVIMFNSQSKTTGKAKALGAVSQEQEKTQFMDTDPEMTGKDGKTLAINMFICLRTQRKTGTQ